jgi:hypothetical protein
MLRMVILSVYDLPVGIKTDNLILKCHLLRWFRRSVVRRTSPYVSSFNPHRLASANFKNKFKIYAGAVEAVLLRR